MRILVTTKPIPTAYLKSGKDNGAYDAEIKLWLPGRTTPVARPDMKFVRRKGVRDHVIPSAPRTPPPQPQPMGNQGPGLWVARKARPKQRKLVIARS